MYYYIKHKVFSFTQFPTKHIDIHVNVICVIYRVQLCFQAKIFRFCHCQHIYNYKEYA